jgi:hypothetical protein
MKKIVLMMCLLFISTSMALKSEIIIKFPSQRERIVICPDHKPLIIKKEINYIDDFEARRVIRVETIYYEDGSQITTYTVIKDNNRDVCVLLRPLEIEILLDRRHRCEDRYRHEDRNRYDEHHRYEREHHRH